MEAKDSGSTDFRAAWSPGSATVEVAGEIDIATAPMLAEALDGALAHARPPIRLDMRGVTFVDASVLGLLVRAQNRYGRGDGVAVVEVIAGPFVEKVMRLAQMEHFLAP